MELLDIDKVFQDFKQKQSIQHNSKKLPQVLKGKKVPQLKQLQFIKDEVNKNYKYTPRLEYFIPIINREFKSKLLREEFLDQQRQIKESKIEKKLHKEKYEAHKIEKLIKSVNEDLIYGNLFSKKNTAYAKKLQDNYNIARKLIDINQFQLKELSKPSTKRSKHRSQSLDHNNLNNNNNQSQDNNQYMNSILVLGEHDNEQDYDNQSHFDQNEKNEQFEKEHQNHNLDQNQDLDQEKDNIIIENKMQNQENQTEQNHLLVQTQQQNLNPCSSSKTQLLIPNQEYQQREIQPSPRNTKDTQNTRNLLKERTFQQQQNRKQEKLEHISTFPELTTKDNSKDINGYQQQQNQKQQQNLQEMALNKVLNQQKKLSKIGSNNSKNSKKIEQKNYFHKHKLPDPENYKDSFKSWEQKMFPRRYQFNHKLGILQVKSINSQGNSKNIVQLDEVQLQTLEKIKQRKERQKRLQKKLNKTIGYDSDEQKGEIYSRFL